MIQRIQTLWLLLAAAACGSMYYLPIFGGQMQDGSIKNFLISSKFVLFLLVIVVTALALFVIFLFRNRPLQMRLIWVGLLLSILIVILSVLYANDFAKTFDFKTATYKAAVALPIVAILSFFVAYRGVRKDEKTVKDADRLR